MPSSCMLVVLLSLVGWTWSDFTPGCSFYNGQCSYTVQLGHQGKCDTPTPAPTPSTDMTDSNDSCCANVTNELEDLRATVSDLANQLKTLSENYLSLDNQTDSNSTTDKDPLLQKLESKEAELNKTATEMAASLHQAREEIQNLRQQLVSTTRQLNTCRGTLGLQSGSTTVSPVLDGSINLTYCDFQTTSARCGFDHHVEGFPWSRHSGGDTSATGPVEDHTYGSPKGYYMFMDVANHLVKGTHTHRMTSNVFQPSQSACIRFWYSMNGHDIKSLKVYAKISGGQGYPIWSLSGDHGKDWHMAEVELDSEYTASPYQIVFEGDSDAYQVTWPSHHYYNLAADIAVDDLYVYNTSCNNVPVCPPGSTRVDINNSTSCYTFHVTPATWYGAASTCREEGAHSSLVSVTSLEEQQFLVDHIQGDEALKTVGAYGYYTSGNDERMEGHFDWTDTGTPYQSVYTNWHTGQPNNVADNQDCLLLQYSSAGFEWGDIDCLSKHPFICETRIPKPQ